MEKEEMERMNMERLKELESMSSSNANNNNNGGGGRMTLLGSLFHHSPLVGQQLRGSNDNSDRNGSSDRSDRGGNNYNINSIHHQQQGNNNNMPKAPYNVDDSFRSNNSVDSHHRPNVLSRATILISRRASSNQEDSLYHNSRRSTMETNPLSEAGDGTNDTNLNNSGGIIGGGGVDVVPPILKTSLLGEDQTGNFAPRKSVGDLTAMMDGYDQESSDDDDSRIFGIDRSRVSAASGLFLSGDEESKASGLQEGHQVIFRGRNEEEEEEEVVDEEETCVEMEILETTLQQLDTATCDTFRSMLSDLSHRTMETKGSTHTDCSGSSLIVGFGKQRDKRGDELRGFAADFSAWDKKR